MLLYWEILLLKNLELNVIELTLIPEVKSIWLLSYLNAKYEYLSNSKL